MLNIINILFIQNFVIAWPKVNVIIKKVQINIPIKIIIKVHLTSWSGWIMKREIMIITYTPFVNWEILLRFAFSYIVYNISYILICIMQYKYDWESYSSSKIKLSVWHYQLGHPESIMMWKNIYYWNFTWALVEKLEDFSIYGALMHYLFSRQINY